MFDSSASFPNHNYDLALIVQLIRLGRAHEIAPMGNQGVGRAHKHGRIFGRLRSIFIFSIPVAVIDTNTENLFRIRNGAQKGHVIETDIHGGPLRRGGGGA